MAAHHIPYVAQSTGFHWADLYRKLEKAFSIQGPAFINVLSPCVPGWKYSSEQTMFYNRLAVETCFWPLFEVENGVWKLNRKPKEKIPVEEWLKGQGRFRHLFQPNNRWIIEQLQAEVDKRWEELLIRCGEK
jgi:pyruvate ferredoxin oxidoreductase beta subunit